MRRIEAGDWLALKRVRLAALADTPLAFGVTLAATQAEPAEAWQERARTSSVDAPTAPTARFLAFRGERPVGIMGGFVSADGEDAGVPTLFTVWVDPTERGTGVADRLLAATVDWARSTGANRMALWVWTANPRARAFYERHGWRATGRSIPHVLDTSHTEIEYDLPLSLVKL